MFLLISFKIRICIIIKNEKLFLKFIPESKKPKVQFSRGCLWVFFFVALLSKCSQSYLDCPDNVYAFQNNMFVIFNGSAYNMSGN